MSETLERHDRAAATAMQRRRRQPGSLNRMVTSALGIPEECKDPDYHYCWVNNVRGRVMMLSTHDDYDVVTVDDLEDEARKNRSEGVFNRQAFLNGEGSQVTIPVERDGTKAVLMRKPRAFFEADYREQIEARQAMMEGRVYHGDLGMEANGKSEDLAPDVTYAPKGNTLGDAGLHRRRGPIPRRVK